MYNMNETLTCIFCGHEYPPGTPSSQHEELYKHIAVCPDHPLSTAFKCIKALYSCGTRDMGKMGNMYYDYIEEFLNKMGHSLDV